MKLEFPYLVIDTDRHGNKRLYVRRHGRKVRVREKPGTRPFTDVYNAALDALGQAAPQVSTERRAAPAGTFGWLATTYFASVEFKALSPSARGMRRGIIESCLQEPLRPGSKDKMALVPIVLLEAKHLRMLRDRRADKPGAANNRLKYLSVMLSWAVERNLIRANPCRDVKHLHYATDGYHTWSPDEVKQFEAHHKVGSKARLALALMLYLGVRRGDAVRLGKQHVRNGAVHFVPNKTRHKKMDAIELPVLPELARIIAASPCGDLTFLMTDYGKPFTAQGFGLWFRARCDEAGLPQCSAHGLRKARASILAERGPTDRQLMAMFGWESEKEATKYTKAASRKRLAAAAMRLEDQNENSDCPTSLSHREKA